MWIHAAHAEKGCIALSAPLVITNLAAFFLFSFTEFTCSTSGNSHDVRESSGLLTNNLKLWIEFKNKKKKQKKKLQARDILSCGSEVVSSYGTAAMLRLSAWMSGMVLSGLRHTANLCGKQGGRVTEEGVEGSVMFFNSPSLFFRPLTCLRDPGVHTSL